MRTEYQQISPAQLAARLETLGLSAEQFASHAGLTHTTIRRHERGMIRNPRRSTLRKMREALADLEEQMHATKDVSWR